MKSSICKFFVLLFGLTLLSCERPYKLGTLYLINVSSCPEITLVSASGEAMVIPKGGYYSGLVYFSNIYGTWSGEHYNVEFLHCVVTSPEIISIRLDNTEYQLNETISRSFSNMAYYTKIIDEREEYMYEMNDDFV